MWATDLEIKNNGESTGKQPEEEIFYQYHTLKCNYDQRLEESKRHRHPQQVSCWTAAVKRKGIITHWRRGRGSWRGRRRHHWARPRSRSHGSDRTWCRRRCWPWGRTGWWSASGCACSSPAWSSCWLRRRNAGSLRTPDKVAEQVKKVQAGRPLPLKYGRVSLGLSKVKTVWTELYLNSIVSLACSSFQKVFAKRESSGNQSFVMSQGAMTPHWQLSQVGDTPDIAAILWPIFVQEAANRWLRFCRWTLNFLHYYLWLRDVAALLETKAKCTKI